jgi:hypothetical protein
MKQLTVLAGLWETSSSKSRGGRRGGKSNTKYEDLTPRSYHDDCQHAPRRAPQLLSLRIMSTRHFIYLTLLAVCFSFSGCRPPQSPGGQCFRDSTGLSLPSSAHCVAAKTITVAIANVDTHYLKFQATNDIGPFLAAHFRPVDWQTVKQDMTPPPAWMTDLAFWSQSEIQQQVHYAGDFTNKNGSKYKVALSYNPNRMVLYFVGMELRD